MVFLCHALSINSYCTPLFNAYFIPHIIQKSHLSKSSMYLTQVIRQEKRQFVKITQMKNQAHE